MGKAKLGDTASFHTPPQATSGTAQRGDRQKIVSVVPGNGIVRPIVGIRKSLSCGAIANSWGTPWRSIKEE
jgi:hypothetical protein